MNTSLEWQVSQSLVQYPLALAQMEQRVADILAGKQPELIWLLEHPPLYTAGTSTKASDLLDQNRFPIHMAGRGGQFTYHGPGQRIAYIMLDLKRRASPRAPDIRAYVQGLEQWIARSLLHFGVECFVREGRVGVWTLDRSGREAKIAAIGIRVRKWVTYHGIAINVHPDLTHYAGIVPCGISEYGVTSLHDLGIHTSLSDVDDSLRTSFDSVFVS